MQAAILQVKFKAFVEYELTDINKVAATYSKLIGEQLADEVVTPIIPTEYYSSWAQYTITLQNKEIRDTLQKHLADKGIPSNVYYRKPMHEQGAFESLRRDYQNDYQNELKVTRSLCERVLSLPMHPYLEEEEIVSVVEAMVEFFAAANR